jgi:hypothetical protein
VGTVLFVSLCGEPGESYYSPDNGYVFKASQAFIDGLKREEIGKDTKKTSAACQSH